jgi:hypothetical protein
MLVDRVDELGVLVLGAQAVVDDLAIGRILLQLRLAILDAGEDQKARAFLPWLRIFCCSKSLVNMMYQEAADITTRMMKVAQAIVPPCSSAAMRP